MHLFSPRAVLNRAHHNRATASRPPLGRAASWLACAALLAFSTPARAQHLAAAPTAAADVLGFEAASAWQLSTSDSGTTFTLTPARTQGTAALSVGNPRNGARLTSRPVASGAVQLAGLGASGASLSIDVRLPGGRLASNSGTLRLSLTSPSRGLHKVPLGKVDFYGLRTGTYQTLSFPISGQARKALMTSAFNDLSFELALTSRVPGEYLFDNLRVRSASGVTADATTRPPAGFGGSVDFDLDLDAPPPVDPITGAALPVPDGQPFELGPVQVPGGFHVKTGTATVTSTLTLDLGYAPASLITSCVYVPDILDAAQKSYVFASCTGGSRPGDIVSASWARLRILNGVSPLRVRAQLARRPLGDQLGTGIIPPMPTFWGDDDTCISGPAGQVVSTSPSCADTLEQTSRIITGYFDAVNADNTADGWIVAPVPEFAKRHGDGSPQNLDAPAPLFASMRSSLAAAPASVPFNQSGHLDEGGLFDAYWQLVGGIDYTSFENTDRATTHLGASFSTHGVLLGQDISVLDVSASADTDTGQTVPGPLPASSHLSTRMHVFGIEYPGFTTDTSGQIDQTIPLFNPPPFDLPPIRIWIFAIKAGVKAQAGLTISGGLQARGIDLALVPQGSIAAHVFGGVDIFVASAGVDASIDLIRVRVPVSASAEWLLDRSPASCSGELVGALDGDITLSSGGGEVDLVVSYGICPFCDDESLTIFDWPALSQSEYALFHETLDIAQFALPTALCTGVPAQVTVQSPSSTFQPVYGAVGYPLTGIASSRNTGLLFGQALTCTNSTYEWSVSNPADIITGTGCDAIIHFANGAHTSVITLVVRHSVTDANGRVLTESGTGSKSVTVSVLPLGVTITSVLNVDTRVAEFFNPLLATTGPAPNGYIVTGEFLPPPGVDVTDIRYRWFAEHAGVTTDITCSLSNLDGCVPDGLGFSLRQVHWMPPNVNDSSGFIVTLKAISKTTGDVVGSDSFLADFYGGVR